MQSYIGAKHTVLLINEVDTGPLAYVGSSSWIRRPLEALLFSV
jgi:hypothetical protein